MKIQLAKLKDAKRIYEIFSKLNTDIYIGANRQDIQNAIGKAQIYTLHHEGKIVAAVEVHIEEGSLEIDKLCSETKGGGTLLVEKCEEICKEKNIPKIWCWSGTNYNAIGFYEKMGFTEKLLMRKQYFGKDCWILGKALD